MRRLVAPRALRGCPSYTFARRCPMRSMLALVVMSTLLTALAIRSSSDGSRSTPLVVAPVPRDNAPTSIPLRTVAPSGHDTAVIAERPQTYTRPSSSVRPASRSEGSRLNLESSTGSPRERPPNRDGAARDEEWRWKLASWGFEGVALVLLLILGPGLPLLVWNRRALWTLIEDDQASQGTARRQDVVLERLARRHPRELVALVRAGESGVRVAGPVSVRNGATLILPRRAAWRHYPSKGVALRTIRRSHWGRDMTVNVTACD